MNQPLNLSDLRHIVIFSVNKDLGDCGQQISVFKIQKIDYDFIESPSIDIILNWLDQRHVLCVYCLLKFFHSSQCKLHFMAKSSLAAVAVIWT